VEGDFFGGRGGGIAGVCDIAGDTYHSVELLYDISGELSKYVAFRFIAQY